MLTVSSLAPHEHSSTVLNEVRNASRSTVFSLFTDRVRQAPDRIAIRDGRATLTYRQLLARVRRLAALMRQRGVAVGDRVALLSENRAEVLEVMLAAASLGAIVACQNWRLSVSELRHCIELVKPCLALASPRLAPALRDATPSVASLSFSEQYERLLEEAAPNLHEPELDPELPLLILYTSGTTGLPKAALLSHRAEIARNLVIRSEFGLAPDDTFVAWSPLYHMGAVDPSLGTLMSGGKVVIVDGFDTSQLCGLVRDEHLGWLLLMPGMVGKLADELCEAGVVPKGIKLCGVMADLVPPVELARITDLLSAPYANTFGATETGCPPGTASPIPVGSIPKRLSKDQSAFCEVRLVDPQGVDVADGEPGELWFRGPTLFSGYFRDVDATRAAFANGWYHMGDVFRRNPDRTLDFIDRVKYLIKSGGENIYPAELERVILQDPLVVDAAVVRRSDATWGEVPVAFVARKDDSVTEASVIARCRAELAGYKRPKAVYFIEMDEFPRSASGKIQRHELEKRLRA